MKVSVVIPAYNEQHYIRSCLDHVCKQTIPLHEIIVVDNNCRDRTVSIAQKYHVRVIHEPTQGMIPARNTGYSSATGDVILRTDADSKVPPQWAEQMVARIKKEHAAAVTGTAYFYDAPLPNVTQISVRTYQMISRAIYGHHILVGPNSAIRKTLWDLIRSNVCLNDREVHEDIDIAIHINRAGGTIVYDPSIVVPISARRLKHNPWSFFGEYTVRYGKTWKKHLRRSLRSE